MTLEFFNRRFAATLDSTEGYSQAQLDAINERVFAAVAHLDETDATTKSSVDFEFERAFADAE